MKIELAGGSVKRLVNVWRDSNPLPGEKSPTRIAVDQYSRDPRSAEIVSDLMVVDTPRWQQFVVGASTAGDRLLATLKDGPVMPSLHGDSWLIDLDRIKRA